MAGRIRQRRIPLEPSERPAKRGGIVVPQHGSFDSLRAVCCNSDAGFLRIGKTEPLVHPGVRWLVRPRFDLRFPSRSLAFWARGGRLVRRRDPTLVGGQALFDETLVE